MLVGNLPVSGVSVCRTGGRTCVPQGVKCTRRLATLIPQHPFEVTIHCVVSSKVIAREVVRAMKKDVLAGTYGCDNSRKQKLFEKEKERQKRLRTISNVRVPPEAFLQLLKF